MFARTDRLPAWITRARPGADVYPVEVRARSARNCGAAPAGRIGHRRAATVFGVRHVDRRRSSTRSSRCSHTRAWRGNGSTVCSAPPSIWSGRAPLFQRHPATGRADRRKRQRRPPLRSSDDRGRRVAGTLDTVSARGGRDARLSGPVLRPDADRGRSAGRSRAEVLDRRNQRRRRPDVRAGGTRRPAKPHRRRRGCHAAGAQPPRHRPRGTGQAPPSRPYAPTSSPQSLTN